MATKTQRQGNRAFHHGLFTFSSKEKKKKDKEAEWQTRKQTEGSNADMRMTLLWSLPRPGLCTIVFFIHNDSIKWFYSIFVDNKIQEGNLSPSHTRLDSKTNYVQLHAPASLYVSFKVRGNTEYNRRFSRGYRWCKFVALANLEKIGRNADHSSFILKQLPKPTRTHHYNSPQNQLFKCPRHNDYCTLLKPQSSLSFRVLCRLF